MLGYGPLPAVSATEGQTGPWDRPGSARVVRLADRTEAREEVTACERPRRFAYRVEGFTHPVLGRLVRQARGEWLFEEAGPSSTAVQWSYTFEPRSVVAVPVLLPIVKILWSGYMGRALRELKRLAEASAA
jgi:Polyketide cyclase / dehydrase and lipid transport